MGALDAEGSSHVVVPATLDDDANDGRKKEKDNDPHFARGNRRHEYEGNSQKHEENTGNKVQTQNEEKENQQKTKKQIRIRKTGNKARSQRRTTKVRKQQLMPAISWTFVVILVLSMLP